MKRADDWERIPVTVSDLRALLATYPDVSQPAPADSGKGEV